MSEPKNRKKKEAGPGPTRATSPTPSPSPMATPVSQHATDETEKQKPETEGKTEETSGRPGRRPGRRPKKMYNVTPDEFVAAWQSSRNAREVAEKLGMPKPIVLSRASAYRTMGIKLKNMKRGGPNTLDVDAINRLIEKLEAGLSPEEAREALAEERRLAGEEPVDSFEDEDEDEDPDYDDYEEEEEEEERPKGRGRVLPETDPPGVPPSRAAERDVRRTVRELFDENRRNARREDR